MLQPGWVYDASTPRFERVNGLHRYRGVLRRAGVEVWRCEHYHYWTRAGRDSAVACAERELGRLELGV